MADQDWGHQLGQGWGQGLSISLSMQSRLGSDGLEDPEHDARFAPGRIGQAEILDLPEELEGEDLDEFDAALSVEGSEDEADHDGRKVGLADLLRSRPPRVLLRLYRDGDVVWTRAAIVPRSDEEALALQELQAVVEYLFAAGRDVLKDDWDRLLDTRSRLRVSERLLLLYRLGVTGGTRISLPGQAVFTPNNRGLESYACKFAALPDGTPFSIGLLLGGARRGHQDHPFKSLPPALKLMALGRALQRERNACNAGTDSDFRHHLHEALKDLGIEILKPDEKQVTRLRNDQLKRNGLAHLFPNRKVRQQAYTPPTGRPSDE